MNSRKLSCRALPALYLAALSLHGQPLSPLQVAIAPGKASPVVVNALPRAACTLRAQGDSGVPHSMTLYSDDQGRVRFHAQAKAESISPAKLDLECQSGNQTASYGIELHANTALASASPAVAAPPAQTGTVRPPLTGDPMAPSQIELISRSYPVRPDPVTLPEAYATWQRAVSTSATVIEPQLIAQPKRFHAATTNPSPVPPTVLPSSGVSSNWSGLVVYQDARLLALNPPQPYDTVSAEWFVPAVTGEPDIQDDSAFWTGMDGWGSNNVLQGGTEQQVFTVAFFGTQFTITNYYAWVEFFPFPEQLISNFSVSPGDHIVASVLMEIPNVEVTVNGTTGLCIMQNLTTGTIVFVTVAPPAGITFTGNTAEWIMERPTVNGVLPDLSNYSAASMFNAYALRNSLAAPPEVTSSGNTNSLNLTMVNAGGAILSEVVPLTDTSMAFRWKGFK